MNLTPFGRQRSHCGTLLHGSMAPPATPWRLQQSQSIQSEQVVAMPELSVQQTGGGLSI